ncbi:hypothetical protein J6TS2_16410 [Heyndrickxia sporothermodurans]|nr:hypothetical protein J6TS2_16410 [Heyndrickxia sporothermodurans]
MIKFQKLFEAYQLVHKFSNNKKIMLFGTGTASFKVSIFMSMINKDISCYIDNDPKKWNKYFMNKKILPPDILNSVDRNKIIIIIASQYYEEIYIQLEKLGFKKNVNMLTLNNFNNIDYTTLTKRTINGVEVGRFTYGYEGHTYQGSLLEKIGSFCSINHSVKIGEVNHPMNFITTHPILYTAKDEILGYEGVPGILPQKDIINIYDLHNNKKIVIGNDVWIGANVIVLPSVTINNGAIIGAGAIVTKDVPAYAIVVGSPARVIKYRFNQKEIDILNKVKWWDWSINEIIENVNLLKNPKNFFETYK